MLPMSLDALSDGLPSHDGFLFLLETLYFLLNPGQLLFWCSFIFFSFIAPILHLDLVELSVTLDILYWWEHPWGDWKGSPPLVWVELVPPPFWLDPAAVVDIVASWCS
jgi:hypothetical protein